MVSKVEPDRYADTGFSVKDTSPAINAMMFKRIMALTDSERFLMGMSMLETSRTLVWNSLPATLDLPSRRRLFYQRFYGQPLPDEVATWAP
ncbi:hypothetical protein GCM10023213_27280 [Prosthecobacter algae]|uniref:Uncharacterized protein n=1 Tax=Prosthecobacter algae TaxID=1144682 RepID=A0ABP9P9C6_9BACT